MKKADIIVPRGRPEANAERNNIAIEFIAQNLEHRLRQSGFIIPAKNVLD